LSQGEKRIILVTGGIRSGKSRFAQKLVADLSVSVRYIATAEARDEEMKKRVHLHQANRPSSWPTVEEPLNLASLFTSSAIQTEQAMVTLIDCITVWVSNMLLQRDISDIEYWESNAGIKEVENNVDQFISAILTYPKSIVIVTNEVGWGGIALSPLGRVYQDILGWTNQKIAAAADEVYFVAAGLPLVLKGSKL